LPSSPIARLCATPGALEAAIAVARTPPGSATASAVVLSADTPEVPSPSSPV